MDLILEEILDLSTKFVDCEHPFWLKCRTSTGSIVIFWGSVDEGKRNIDALKNQVFPVHIVLDDPGECVA